jgi:hypothetical protein
MLVAPSSVTFWSHKRLPNAYSLYLTTASLLTQCFHLHVEVTAFLKRETGFIIVAEWADMGKKETASPQICI